MLQKPARTPWIDYLRGFITLLVVAHHSSLAYTTFAWFNKDAYITSTHPVVDTIRWRGLDLFEDFNDIFFMSLMFLISGIFVLQSLRSKGVSMFIRDRFYRLFIPFAIGVTVLMLLAYFPAYYLAHGNTHIGAYITDFFTVEAWPVGPPWFIWVLFLFNLVFAVGYAFMKNLRVKQTGLLNYLKQHPAAMVLIWYMLTWVLYMPLLLAFGPDKWTGLGPFDFQLSRILLYFGYFLLGVLIGNGGLKAGLFSDDSKFARRWPVWIICCLSVYTLVKLSEAPLLSMFRQGRIGPIEGQMIYRSIWALSCTMSSIAFLTGFKAWFRGPKRWWDALSANAYGIYLTHYIFVIWIQFWLLRYDLPAVVKFLITFVLSVGASWGLTYWVRRIGIVRRYL